MDHYRTLGLTKDATKEEIKESFRRSALNFHPDRHVQSSELVRQRAILRFKQACEAYEVLIDDRKRADYDFNRRHAGGRGGASPAASGGYRRRSAGGGGSGLDVEYLFRFMTARGVLFSLAFARNFEVNKFQLSSILLGGAVVAERSVDAVWRLNNSGKSFEDAMESIEKVGIQKDH
ncbi:chaperone protein dnaJ 72 isoform X1 [Phalaenopsis equestris]|uniref:chaperone protein dnaJ 72 isoform X1 n=1 Tax=Phalaenopsis equestris TaxID=78828 RepID=UPI0009E33846|nr:chaperone protein dnaJ 72 isoform X1 [Phalaenopsis equestris]